MDRYHFGRNYFISLPDLHWKITPHWFMIGKIHVLRLLWGGLLGLFLSFILADFLSRELFVEYSSWTGWREIMGSSPNTITNGLKKISWALLFCSSWWMIWKLDHFFTLKPKAHEKKTKEEETPIEPESKTEGEQMEESTENADIASETSESEDTTEENTSEETSEKPSPEDIAFAEVLSLSIEEIGKIEDLKSIYRKRIAQYHPDKVLAMGPEIRSVAEQKAKEINEAYEHFRRKFPNG